MSFNYCDKIWCSKSHDLSRNQVVLSHLEHSRTIPSVYRLEADKPNEDLPNTVCLVHRFPKTRNNIDCR
ncbi:unnamed protein product [Ranitomeya imitator]|uniref:Uncharacterized protein n=1 Tax=Ranitomeya imitator TaxID=111125 RepID=A0ABN9M235_9NEOB|nr:unnamed protein product [Ranitomeya imitator]